MKNLKLFFVKFVIIFFSVGLLIPGYLSAEKPKRIVDWQIYSYQIAVQHNQFLDKMAASMPSIYSGYLDAEGNVWICTSKKKVYKINDNGIFEPNGQKAEFDNDDNSNSDADEDDQKYKARFVVLDQQKNLWASDTHTIYKYENDSWLLITPDKDLFPYSYIGKMKIDLHGNLWVKGFMKDSGLKVAGLSKYDGESWTHFFGENSNAPQNEIYDFDLDENGHVWVCSPKTGIVKYDGENWHLFKEANAKKPDFTFYCISYDPYNKVVWAGGNSTSLIRFDEKKYELIDLAYEQNKKIAAENQKRAEDSEKNLKALPKFLRKVKKIQDKPIEIKKMDFRMTGICVDSKNSRWVGTEENGLFYVTDNYIGLVSSSDFVLTSNFIHKLQVNELGQKLITCRTPGDSFHTTLAILDDSPAFKHSNWQVYHKMNSSLPNIPLDDLAFDKKGVLWGVSTGEGLLKFTLQKSERFASLKSLIGDRSNHLAIMPNGDILLSAIGQNFKKFNGSGFDSYKDQTKKVIGKVVDDMAVDQKGNLWVASSKGLTKYDGSSWTLFNKKQNGLPSDSFYDIMIDSNDNIWMGTKDGLIKYDNNTFTLFDSKNSPIPANKVYAVSQDNAGIIWAGTSKGLVSYDGNQWTTIDQFKEKKVKKLKCDSKGNIWVVRNEGELFRFDGQAWVYYNYENSPVICEEILDMEEYDGGLWISVSWLKPGADFPFQENSAQRQDHPHQWLLNGLKNESISYALIRFQL